MANAPHRVRMLYLAVAFVSLYQRHTHGLFEGSYPIDDRQFFSEPLGGEIEGMLETTGFCESLTTFRKHLKTFYFQSAFHGAR